MIYDVIVIGGGIAGLYTAYELLLRQRGLNILVLEGQASLGGRIHTYNGRHMMVEAGAGRFSKSHRLLNALIQDFGLDSVPIRSGSVFVSTRPYVGDHVALLKKVIHSSRTQSREVLQHLSFVEYARSVVGDDSADLILRSFGYYSELCLMNAYDCIRLIRSLSNSFCVLKGGLGQLIDGLGDGVRRLGGRILVSRMVESIDFVGGLFEVLVVRSGDSRNTVYSGRKCVCALPRPALEKIAIFRPIRGLLKSVVCSPLCRIYCRYPTDLAAAVKGSWFAGLPKITTDNPLRMVIPVDEGSGVLMASYTDNRFARAWKRLLDRSGIHGVEAELGRLLSRTTGRDVPKPLETRVFYWDCGVGYWGVGVDSRAVAAQMLQPFPGLDLFVCGEHFSWGHQQWIEGALETSRAVVDRLVSH